MITEIDDALLSYEKTIAVASEEGVDVATKEVRYEWTYVQSVFFSSTIITTVGIEFNRFPHSWTSTAAIQIIPDTLGKEWGRGV